VVTLEVADAGGVGHARRSGTSNDRRRNPDLRNPKPNRAAPSNPPAGEVTFCLPRTLASARIQRKTMPAEPAQGPRTDSPERIGSPSSPRTDAECDAERELQEKGRARLRERLFAPRY